MLGKYTGLRKYVEVAAARVAIISGGGRGAGTGISHFGDH